MSQEPQSYRELKARMDAMMTRIERLESVIGVDDSGNFNSDSVFDHRDRAVLAVLADLDPDEVRIQDLQRVYRKHTNVRRKNTIRERIKHLTQHGPFEYVGSNRWRYTG